MGPSSRPRSAPTARRPSARLAHLRHTGLALALFLWATCAACVADRPHLAGQIEGRAIWMGPIAQAPITLSRVAADGSTQPLAHTRSDATGHFHLAGLPLDVGTYRLSADLSGLPWRWAGHSGEHPPGLRLSVRLRTTQRYAHVRTSLTALTTLTDALEESLSAAGSPPDALGTAQDAPLTAAALPQALQRWLGVDPAHTALDDTSADLHEAAARHALLLEAFDQLPAQLARDPREPPAPAALLDALRADALGATPAARFDGLGPQGPLTLPALSAPFDGQILQAHLAEGVAQLGQRSPRWRASDPHLLAQLAGQLRCSGAALFAPCALSAEHDRPHIEVLSPPLGAPLPEGTVTLQLRVHSPLGRIARLDVALIEGGQPRPLSPTATDPQRFLIDTQSLSGQRQLDVQITAVSASGGRSTLRAQWPLRDRTPARLTGAVMKGPGRAVRVRAFDLRAPSAPLAEGYSDARGAFQLELVHYAGPLLLVADGQPQPAPSEAPTHDDELRGERPWPAEHTMRALVPHFDTAAPTPWPHLLSPWSDLALTFAQTQGEATAPALIAAYEAALAGFATQMGLDPQGLPLLHTLPDAHANGADDDPAPARIAALLGCWSAQAWRLAQTLEAPQRFDGLDLLALYRADLAADGRLDGLAHGRPLHWPPGDDTPPQLTLPRDGLRGPLATDCGYWRAHPRNPQPLSLSALHTLQEQLRGPAPQAPYGTPTPSGAADTQPPTLQLSAQVDPAAPLAAERSAVYAAGFPPADRPAAPGSVTVLRGAVTITLTLSDPSGIGAARLWLPSAPRPHREAARADLSPTQTQLTLHLDTTSLDEGPQRLAVYAQDLAGNTHEATLRFDVDHHAPALRWHSDTLPGQRLGARHHTAHAGPAAVQLTWADDHPVHVQIELDGARLHDAGPLRAEGQQQVRLDLAARPSGSYRLRATATDAVGLTHTEDLWIEIDREAPTLHTLPTEWFDELTLGPARAPDDETPTVRSDDPLPLVRRWQTTWGADDPWPAELHYALDDGEGSGATPPEQLRLIAHTCLSDAQGHCLEAQPIQEHELFGPIAILPLTANDPAEGPAALPFDPLTAPPEAGYVAVQLHELRDLAGNRRALAERQVLRYEVIAPPLSVAVQAEEPFEAEGPSGAPPAHLRPLAALRIEAGDLAALLTGQLQLHRYRVRVHNPHAIPVRLSVHYQGSNLLQSTVREVLKNQRPTIPSGPLLSPCPLDAQTPQPEGLLDPRPVQRVVCDPLPGGQPGPISCAQCVVPAPLSQRAALQRSLTASTHVRLYGPQGPLTGQKSGNAQWWQPLIEPGQSVAFDLSLALNSASASPVHFADEGAPQGHAAQLMAESVYQRLGQLPLENWMNGALYLEVSALTLEPKESERLRLGAQLFERLSAPLTVHAPAQQRVERAAP